MPKGKRKRPQSDQTSAPAEHNSDQSRKTGQRTSVETDDRYYETAAILSEDPLKKLYLIRWKGRDSSRALHKDTWEPYDNVLPETVKEWRTWKKSHKPFKNRPDSDFEKLPYPRGWHLRGSPVSTQSSHHTDSQNREVLSEAEPSSPVPSRPRKKKSRVVNSPASATPIRTTPIPPLEPHRPAAGQARESLKPQAPPNNRERIIPDSQTQRQFVADLSTGPTLVEKVSAQPTSTENSPVDDTQHLVRISSESQEPIFLDQSSPENEDSVSGQSLQQPTQESQYHNDISATTTQEISDTDAPNAQDSVVPHIGDTFLRLKQTHPEVHSDSPDQTPTIQQFRSSASLSSPMRAGGSSQQVITDTPATVGFLSSRLQRLEETNPRNQRQFESASKSHQENSDETLQPQHLGQTQDLSSLPHPPSQPLDEPLDSLAPPRPWTPLDIEMSTRSSARQTPNRDLSDGRSPRSARRSPRLPVVTNELSVPLAQANEASRALNSSITLDVSLGTADATKNENTTAGVAPKYSEIRLPIQMTGEQSPWCPRVIQQALASSRTVREFLDSETGQALDEASAREIASVFSVLSRIEDHADLITPDETEPSQIIPLDGRVAWNRRASSKIVLLEAVIDQIKEGDKMIAVLARPGTFADIIKDTMVAKDVNWMQFPGAMEMEGSRPKPMVLLLTDDSPKVSEYLGQIDLVLDLAPRNSYGIDQMRARLAPHINSSKRPAISPVPVYTISHFMCTSSDKKLGEETLQRLALSKFDSRSERTGEWKKLCGKLPRGMPDAKKLGGLIGAAVHNGSPFTDLPRLEDVALPTNISIIASSDITRTASPVGQKRDRGQAAMSPPAAESKKPRLSDNTGSSLSQAEGLETAGQRSLELHSTVPEGSLTHISNSTPAAPTQAKESSSLPVPQIQVESTAQRQMTLERANFVAQEEALAALASRFERLSTENGALQRKLVAATKLQNAAETRAQKLQLTLDTLKEERAAMRAEVDQTRADLASSTVTDLQELAALRAKAARVDSLEKQLTSQKETNEYITQQYRAASDGAVQEASVNAALREENVQLKKRADEQAVGLRKLFEEKSLLTAQDEVKKQMQQVKSQDRLLERLANANEALLEKVKELEDREEARHGMAGATRSGSRAQTPRASSMGPGQSSQGHGLGKGGLGPESAALRAVLEGTHGRGGAAMSRGNSRQGSPAYVSANGSANGGANGGGRSQGNAPMVPSHLRD